MEGQVRTNYFEAILNTHTNSHENLLLQGHTKHRQIPIKKKEEDNKRTKSFPTENQAWRCQKQDIPSKPAKMHGLLDSLPAFNISARAASKP